MGESAHCHFLGFSAVTVDVLTANNNDLNLVKT